MAVKRYLATKDNTITNAFEDNLVKKDSNIFLNILDVVL